MCRFIIHVPIWIHLVHYCSCDLAVVHSVYLRTYWTSTEITKPGCFFFPMQPRHPWPRPQSGIPNQIHNVPSLQIYGLWVNYLWMTCRNVSYRVNSCPLWLSELACLQYKLSCGSLHYNPCFSKLLYYIQTNWDTKAACNFRICRKMQCTRLFMNTRCIFWVCIAQ